MPWKTKNKQKDYNSDTNDSVQKKVEEEKKSKKKMGVGIKKKLFGGKASKNGNNNKSKDPHIGEIPKPVVVAVASKKIPATPSPAKSTATARTVTMTPSPQSSGKSQSRTPTTPTEGRPIILDSESDVTDYDEEHNVEILNEDPNFGEPCVEMEFHNLDHRGSTQQWPEETNNNNNKNKTNTSHQQTQQDDNQFIPKFQFEDDSDRDGQKTRKNGGINMMKKSLGDDLTASTVFTQPFSPKQGTSVYIPKQIPQMINSLQPDIPKVVTNDTNDTKTPTLRDLEKDQWRKNQLMILTRASLSRPFGRTSLPAHLAKKWNVEIGSPIWDEKETTYKYPISIHEDFVGSSDSNKKLSSALPPPTATTKRSLKDFVWLEQALRNEFHGGILLPLLSILLGKSSDIEKVDRNVGFLNIQDLIESRKVVDEKILAEWLSDVLNGIRGNGEILMNFGEGIDIFSSESMESFLYRTNQPHNSPAIPIYRKSYSKLMSESHLAHGENSRHDGIQPISAPRQKNESFIKGVVKQSLACFAPVQQDLDMSTTHNNNNNNMIPGCMCVQPSPTRTGAHSPLNTMNMLNCTSRQQVPTTSVLPDSDLSVALLNSPNFTILPQSSHIAIHSELIYAQRDLINNYLRLSLICIRKLRNLLAQETQRNNAWKRFAIALSNLFSFEKDIETSKIGADLVDSEQEKESSRGVHVKINLSKTTLSEGLRILTRQKFDRNTPSLRVLNGMLQAYITDLHMVDPSLLSHMDSISQISNDFSDEQHHQQQSHAHPAQSPSTSLQQIGQRLKQQIAGSQNTTQQSFSSSSRNSPHNRLVEAKILQNENLLKKSLTMLIKSVPLRMSRMAWKYFKMEANQASLLNGAAVSLRTKISEGKSRHKASRRKSDKSRDSGATKDDDEIEIELIQRILDLGKKTEFEVSTTQNGINNDDGVDEYERIRVASCEKAINLARERVGRWDSNLALEIMEIAGVADAEVRVEETTRDLRLVRKQAIGLREKVERCVEAVEALMVQVVGDVNDMVENVEVERNVKRSFSVSSSFEPSLIPSHHVPISMKSRREFLSILSKVFSGAILQNSEDQHGKSTSRDHHENHKRSSMPSASVLSGVGIDPSDPTGWLSACGDDNDEAIERVINNIPHNVPITEKRGNCGRVALTYYKVREANISSLLSRISMMLRDYEKRVEGIESVVYMHCIGIQLEKHFGKNRAKLVAEWEKKTDITTAINVAKRKKLSPQLLEELNAKHASLENVSYTAVKQAKERHLASKTIKTDLINLANRRFLKAKESSTERILDIIMLWAQYEEIIALEESKSLGEVIREIERTITEKDIIADGGAHLFAAAGMHSSPCQF